MSHKYNPASVGVLAHFQPLDCRPSAHLTESDADDLVRRMICERISQKLIRMLPPESTFLAASRPNRPAAYPIHDLPSDNMPNYELPGLYFEDPNPVRRRSLLQMVALPSDEMIPAIYWLAI